MICASPMQQLPPMWFTGVVLQTVLMQNIMSKTLNPKIPSHFFIRENQVYWNIEAISLKVSFAHMATREQTRDWAIGKQQHVSRWLLHDKKELWTFIYIKTLLSVVSADQISYKNNRRNKFIPIQTVSPFSLSRYFFSFLASWKKEEAYTLNAYSAG